MANSAKRQGNYRRGRRAESLAGREIGKLSIVSDDKIYYDKSGRPKDRIALTSCEHGVEKEIRVTSILAATKMGRVLTCGCVLREAREMLRWHRQKRHRGHSDEGSQALKARLPTGGWCCAMTVLMTSSIRQSREANTHSASVVCGRGA